MVVDTISLEKGLRLEFNKAYAELAGKYAEGLGRLITVTKSTHNNEKYGLFGDVPSVKEWIGDKTAGNLEDYDYTITNKDWYTAISLDRNEIEDDEMGLLPPRIQLMVKVIRDYRAELVANLIINGTTNLAYDGSAFFANRTAPNDNLLTGTGTTVAQLQTDIGVARAAMRKFESDTGRKMGLLMDTIVCPAELEFVMLQAVYSDLAGAAGEKIYNPLKDWIKEVIAVPDLSDEDDWYGFATDFPLLPFVYQERKEPTPVLDESEVKRNRTLTFSAEGRGNAGYGFPQMAVKVTNT